MRCRVCGCLFLADARGTVAVFYCSRALAGAAVQCSAVGWPVAGLALMASAARGLTRQAACPRITLMPMKNAARTAWLAVLAVIAALFLYVSFAGRTPTQQPQEEFPVETAPPSTRGG